MNMASIGAGLFLQKTSFSLFLCHLYLKIGRDDKITLVLAERDFRAKKNENLGPGTHLHCDVLADDGIFEKGQII